MSGETQVSHAPSGSLRSSCSPGLGLQGDLRPDSFPATFLQLLVHTFLRRRD